MDEAKLIEELIRDEGERLKPYVDSVGKITIGVGRNLTDVGISQVEARFLLSSDIARVLHDLDNHAPWYRSLSESRQRVLANMCFNMGWGDGRHGLSSFVATLEDVKLGRYRTASTRMLSSLWAHQVGARAERLAAIMRGDST